MLSWAQRESRPSVDFVHFEAGMKPMNAWSMVILLVVVVALIIWLRPH